MLAIALGGLVVGWLVQLYFLVRAARSVPRVSSLSAPAPARWPKLSIIVPARDEAEGIEAALRSKLACGYPDLEIVAVDDRSTDGTGEIIDRVAAADPRIAAAHVTALPDGWLGKLNAMAKGLERATGEWVLFSDADVHVEPGTLERLVAHAEHDAVDFIAVFPLMRPVSLALDAGVMCLLRVLALSGRVWRANDDRSGVGLGVGAFNLARKRVLDSTRAISRLRMEVADDVGLGALLKHEGARTRLFVGRNDVHLVFHPTLRAALRSAEKGGHMLGFGVVMPLLSGAVPVVLDVVLPIWGLLSGGTTAALACAVLALGTASHVLLAAAFAAPMRGALAWPLGSLITGPMMAIAGLRAWWQQGVSWRGTFYPRAMLEQGRVLDLPALKVRA